MRLPIQGTVLFLFIPLVLFLYLRQPFGPLASVLVGLAIMVGHRFAAAPWMSRHATERCLWCGRRLPRDPASPDPAWVIRVIAGGREHAMAACRRRHREDAVRFLTFVARWRVPIGIGIFVPLLVLLSGSLARAAGHPLLSHNRNAWQFRTIVAFTVVVVSFAYRAGQRPLGAGGSDPAPDGLAQPLRSPFPLHNLFLLGIRNTLWVFRLVGVWWLTIGLLSLAGR